jgi:hypothetical protein
MITVRIPKDIREYKEKLVAGLNVRQIVCAGVIFGVNVPLYFWGRDKFSEGMLQNIILVIAGVFGFAGFFRMNGMPLEKFAAEYVRNTILCPRKRRFKTALAFREWGEMYDKEAAKRAKKPSLAKKRQMSYERAYLIEQKLNKGENVDFKGLDGEILTVKRGGKKPKKEKRKKEKKKITKFDKLNAQVAEIRQKQETDAHYIPTRKEKRIILACAKEAEKEEKKKRKTATETIKKNNIKLTLRRNLKPNLPKSVQDTLPYIADYDEGVFEVLPSQYSKTYVLTDVNYTVAKQEEQEIILALYCEFLNYFSEDYNVAITVDNRIVSREEQKQKIFYSMTGDAYDRHRTEYNRIMQKQIEKGRNDLIQTKYVTVTISADTPYEAISKFHKVDGEVIQNLKKIGSNGRPLSTDERLAMLHDKFRKGREGALKIDYQFIKAQGISSKDYVAPTSIYFDKKYLVIESQYYRVMYLNNLPTVLADNFFAELVDTDYPLISTINIQPLAQDKGVKMIRKQMNGMESNKIAAQKKAIKSGYSPDIINHTLQQSLAEAEELYDDVTRKNQKMFYVTATFMIGADSLEDLDDRCKMLENKARKQTCQMQTLDFQQEQGLRVTLPFGIPTKKQLYVERTLTTESTGIFIPFSSQELFQPGGFYYGLNQISRNLILCDRTAMKTPSGFLLGSSGSGKSFATKREILNVLLKDNKTSVLIIDPENEYADFVRQFGGEVIAVSADSDNYMNPMDMPEDYGLDEDDDSKGMTIEKKKEKALQKKSDYLMSIIECMISMGSRHESIITPQQKTIVDRCVRKCYFDYLENGFDEKHLPTMLDLQKYLDEEAKGGSDDAKKIAEGVEYYTKGSMNLFSHLSNTNFNNRAVSFNIRDLGAQLKQISLLIVLDFIWNRMINNFEDGVRTYCYVDEIHVLFQNEYSARFLQQLYKRGRKYGLVITGITQNMEDLLRSDMARGMIGNSDFIMMLNQASEDLKILAPMLKISEAQASFVTKAEAGSGLLFAGDVLVPFQDQFPSDSYLYKLMSTKFGEGKEDKK